MSDEIQFDAIVVEEVTEVTNESAIDVLVGDGQESDEEDEDEKTVVESVNSEEQKEEVAIPTPSAKTREDRKEPDNMELRRALHRAGIDSRQAGKLTITKSIHDKSTSFQPCVQRNVADGREVLEPEGLPDRRLLFRRRPDDRRGEGDGGGERVQQQRLQGILPLYFPVFDPFR